MMELILADIPEVKVTEDMRHGVRTTDKRYSILLEVKGRDNSFISVITGGELRYMSRRCFPHRYSSVTLHLTPANGRINYDALLESDKNGINLLKRLRELFQDKVRISMAIFTTPQKIVEPSGSEKGLTDFYQGLSIKGMVIDADKYTCNDRSANIRKFLNSYEKSYYEYSSYGNTYGKYVFLKDSFRVKITAQIDHANVILPNGISLKEKNKKILEEDVASDVIITAANGKEIKSHKCFLVSTSSVLKRMFENKMEETKSGRIDMSDVSEEGIKAYLRFIYHGDVIGPNEKLDVAYNLLYAAHKYDVPKLEVFMRTYLIGRKDEDFDAKLAFKIYSFVKGIETASELTAKMTCIMGMNFDALKEIPEFMEVFEKNPCDAVEICSSVIKSMKKKTTFLVVTNNTKIKQFQFQRTKEPRKRALEAKFAGLTFPQRSSGDFKVGVAASWKSRIL